MALTRVELPDGEECKELEQNSLDLNQEMQMEELADDLQESIPEFQIKVMAEQNERKAGDHDLETTVDVRLCRRRDNFLLACHLSVPGVVWWGCLSYLPFLM